MLQASRADNFPSEFGISPARSSPIICAADLLTTLLWLLYGLYSGLGLRGSMRRMRIDLGLVRESEEHRLSNGMPTYGLVLFGVAVLPQAIRVFAANGLHWTMAWIALYFTAYLVSVTATFVGTQRKHRDRLLENHDSESERGVRIHLTYLTDGAYLAAYAVQVILWIWCANQVVGLVAGQRIVLTAAAAKGLFASFILGFIFLGLLAVVFLCFAAKSARHDTALGICAVISALFALALFIIIVMASPVHRFVAAITSTNQKQFRSGLQIPFLVLEILTVVILLVAAVLLLDSMFRILAHWVEGGEIDVAAAKKAFYRCSGGNIPLPLDDEELGIRQSSNQRGHGEPDPCAEGSLAQCSTEPNIQADIEDQAEGRGPHRRVKPKSISAPKASTKSSEESSEKPSEERWKEALPVSWETVAELPDSIRRVVSIAFAVITLTFGVLYYVLRYDPDGTARSAWVANFGK